MKTVIGIVLGSVVLLSGCATITRGSTEAFNVETAPPEAKVTVFQHTQGAKNCISPCSVQVKRSDPVTVTAEKDGYETSTSNTKPRIDGGGWAALFGNLIFGGIIGVGVDTFTGAAYTNGHSKDPHTAVLDKVAEETPETPTVGQ